VLFPQYHLLHLAAGLGRVFRLGGQIGQLNDFFPVLLTPRQGGMPRYGRQPRPETLGFTHGMNLLQDNQADVLQHVIHLVNIP